MKTAIAFAAMTTTAFASPMWEGFSFQVNPLDAKKVVGAVDTFMGTSEGESFPGRLVLQQNVVNGANPTTHTFVVLYKSAAEAETWRGSIAESRAWENYLKTVTPIMTPTGEARYGLVKSWGEASDESNVWEIHYLQVSDPGAVVAAMNAWGESATAGDFTGEVYLSAADAAGLSNVTHIVSVGFKSEADREAWNDTLPGNPDFAAFIEQMQAASTYLGSSISREVKEWGKSINDMLEE